MFRTVFASLSVTGVSLAKNFFSLSAAEDSNPDVNLPEIWMDPIEKLSTATLTDEDHEDRSEWMAEPLTDKVGFTKTFQNRQCLILICTWL
jgi:hypothetical protein